MNSLPFIINGAYEGFAELEGIARLDEDGSVVLEFQVTDGLVGVFKSDPKEVRIPVADLEEVTYARGLFRCAVTFRVRRMGLLALIPGSKEGEVRLLCKRKHRRAAQDLASDLSMRLVDQQLRAINSSILNLSPPPPSSSN